jgi:hypothetical protein
LPIVSCSDAKGVPAKALDVLVRVPPTTAPLGGANEILNGLPPWPERTKRTNFDR